MWKIMSSYGIHVECIRKVGFLFELVQNWSPTAIPDAEVCFFFPPVPFHRTLQETLKILYNYCDSKVCIFQLLFICCLWANLLKVCSIVAELYNLLEVATHAPVSSESLSFDQIAFFVNPSISLLANVELRDTSQARFTSAAASMVNFLASYQYLVLCLREYDLDIIF